MLTAKVLKVRVANLKDEACPAFSVAALSRESSNTSTVLVPGVTDWISPRPDRFNWFPKVVPEY